MRERSRPFLALGYESVLGASLHGSSKQFNTIPLSIDHVLMQHNTLSRSQHIATNQERNVTRTNWFQSPQPLTHASDNGLLALSSNDTTKSNDLGIDITTRA